MPKKRTVTMLRDENLPTDSVEEPKMETYRGLARFGGIEANGHDLTELIQKLLD